MKLYDIEVFSGVAIVSVLVGYMARAVGLGSGIGISAVTAVSLTFLVYRKK